MLAQAGRGLVQRVLGPVAARMTRVHPNVLTLAGLGTAVVAGYALSRTGQDAAWFLVAAGLCVVYGLLDALDGALARAQGRESALGDFLDHTCDRASALVALGGLALADHANERIILALMLATLWHGFLGTQLEASFGRRLYEGVGIGESLLAGLAYTLTCWWIRTRGLPFYFMEPVFGRPLSVTDAFALAAMPFVALGTVQRLVLAARLARDSQTGPKEKR